MKTLQKFASVHGSVHNHFAPERHLVSRKIYKQRWAAALATLVGGLGLNPGRGWARCAYGRKTSCLWIDSTVTDFSI